MIRLTDAESENLSIAFTSVEASMQVNMAEARGREIEHRRERLLRGLSAVTFLICFQAYMVAPLVTAPGHLCWGAVSVENTQG